MNARYDDLLADMMSTFRRTLHAVPERANQESHTASIVESFLTNYSPDELHTSLGGHGLAAVFAGPRPGPTVLVRCELDALGCATAGTLDSEAAHRCGHDGHMAIVSGLAPLFASQRPVAGRVVLLYQPAEETGEGARRVIDDPRFEPVRPDYAMALHNLPGVPEGTVVLRSGTFACASVGMVLSLAGRAGHAAEPRLAASPRAVLAKLMLELVDLDRDDEGRSMVGGDDGARGAGLRMLTVTHAQLGTPSFGITPGDATLFCTMRATTQVDLEGLKAEAMEVARRAVEGTEITMDVEWFDAFPHTESSDDLVELLERTARAEELAVRRADWPMRWSEDFGHFSKVCPSLYFGLGMGEHGHPLHHPEYAFDDAQIMTGTRLFEGMVRTLLASSV